MTHNKITRKWEHKKQLKAHVIYHLGQPKPYFHLGTIVFSQINDENVRIIWNLEIPLFVLKT